MFMRAQSAVTPAIEILLSTHRALSEDGQAGFSPEHMHQYFIARENPLRKAGMTYLLRVIVETMRNPSLPSMEEALEILKRPVHASGLKWQKCTGTQPPTGTELSIEALSNALTTKLEFTADEWKAFCVKNLKAEHFVKAGDQYFQPAPHVSDLAIVSEACMTVFGSVVPMASVPITSKAAMTAALFAALGGRDHYALHAKDSIVAVRALLKSAVSTVANALCLFSSLMRPSLVVHAFAPCIDTFIQGSSLDELLSGTRQFDDLFGEAEDGSLKYKVCHRLVSCLHDTYMTRRFVQALMTRWIALVYRAGEVGRGV